MKGLVIIGVAAALAAHAAAHAAPAPKRENCPRVDRQSEAQRQQQQSQQQGAQPQRTKKFDCRPSRPVPSLVDPTPVFIL